MEENKIIELLERLIKAQEKSHELMVESIIHSVIKKWSRIEEVDCNLLSVLGLKAIETEDSLLVNLYCLRHLPTNNVELRRSRKFAIFRDIEMTKIVHVVIYPKSKSHPAIRNK